MDAWTIEDHSDGWDVYHHRRIVQYGLESEEDALDVIRRKGGCPTTVTVVERDGFRRTVKLPR